MIRHALAALALLSTAPAAAQSTTQAELQERYDRALAAGYKALMLCSAIGNAEANGASRTPESVHEWELTGIQAPLDEIVRELPYEIERVYPFDTEFPPTSREEIEEADDLPDIIREDMLAEIEDFEKIRGKVSVVIVEWAEDQEPRWAAPIFSGRGCHLPPIGSPPYVGEGVHAPSDGPEIASSFVPISQPAVEPLVNAALAEGYGAGSRTTGIVVQRARETIAESYATDFGPNTPQRTWSVAKSLAATLVGSAVFRGETKVENPAGMNNSTLLDLVSAGLDETVGQEIVLPLWPLHGDVTLDHLLRMASGRYSDTPGNRTDAIYWGGENVEERARYWPFIHKPGTVFRYANNDTLMAIFAISDSLVSTTPRATFDAIGMDHTVAEQDMFGNYILSSQVWSTARDLARFGQLYLDNGVTQDGTRILPENWVEYVSTPSGPQPEGKFGYGAGFWLFNKSEGIPTDTIAAMGNRGQYVVIVPSRDVVIVRRGEDPAGARFDIEAFTRDVLAALPE